VAEARHGRVDQRRPTVVHHVPRVAETIETTLEGGGTIRTAMIVTSEADAVSARVLEELERGVTVLEGVGAYTGADRPVLYCVITRAEVATLKAIVHEVDPQAFMVIGVAHEALGAGFKPLKSR